MGEQISDIAQELERLNTLKGKPFIRQLELITRYNARLLAADIKTYFEVNRKAIEVLLFKGKKAISVNRYATQSPKFYRQFRKKYEQ